MTVKTRKIAIYGGAFDPPHNVHLDIARAAADEFGYDRIFFLPSFLPPHKQLSASVGDRLDMLRLAVARNPKFSISVYEIDKGTVGYIVETLPALKRIYGEFDFIIGGDSLRDLHKWYKPEKILAENSIIVAIRDGDRVTAAESLKFFDSVKVKSVKFMKYVPRSLSSSDVRLSVALGEDISGAVPQEVAEFIKSTGLYDYYRGIRENLRSSLSADRYNHTLGVVKCAIKLNEQTGLDYDKVFTAALLHDCAKCADSKIYDDKIPADSVGTPVAHAFIGKYAAMDEYGITDDDVLNAIYYHTTGRAVMTELEKLIFTADMIEDSRAFDGVDELRRISHKNIAEGFKACLTRQYEFLLQSGKPIYELTRTAYEYYCRK